MGRTRSEDGMGFIGSRAAAVTARAIAALALAVASTPADALTETPPGVAPIPPSERPARRLDVAAGPAASPAPAVLQDDLRVTLGDGGPGAGAGSVLFSNFEEGGFGFEASLPAPRLADD
jgi:hypothetical protein